MIRISRNFVRNLKTLLKFPFFILNEASLSSRGLGTPSVVDPDRLTNSKNDITTFS